jgi:hypothetical protein
MHEEEHLEQMRATAKQAREAGVLQTVESQAILQTAEATVVFETREADAVAGD